MRVHPESDIGPPSIQRYCLSEPNSLGAAWPGGLGKRNGHDIVLLDRNSERVILCHAN